MFGHLGFLPLTQPAAPGEDDSKPDFFLKDPTGARNLSAAFVYPWGRWLDGPDFQDPDHPDENPGARVVAAIEEGQADWAIVTNGRLWRLYSRKAHARSTNFYEVDFIEALNVSGETDPNEAFRYWWLFFRSAAFQKRRCGTRSAGSTASSRAAGIMPSGWAIASRSGSSSTSSRAWPRASWPTAVPGSISRASPPAEELADIYEATLTLLYRLLFLLYAESRDLLPVREGPYGEASLKKLKEEIADKAGVALEQTGDLIKKAYSDKGDRHSTTASAPCSRRWTRATPS